MNSQRNAVLKFLAIQALLLSMVLMGLGARAAVRTPSPDPQSQAFALIQR